MIFNLLTLNSRSVPNSRGRVTTRTVIITRAKWGWPLFYRLYRGHRQDAKTFAETVEVLLDALRTGFTHIHDLVLVLGKSNNSRENFAVLRGQVQWVGSLTPSRTS